MKGPILSLENLRPKLLISLLLGVIVVSVLVAYGDFGKVLHTLARFRWEYLPVIFGLTLVNYALRFVKWHNYIHQIGVKKIGKTDSLLIFLSGLSLLVTPGKIGEWVKCYLLQEATAIPFSRSAPIVIAERLTDGVALIFLASGGLFLFRIGWQIIAVVLVIAVGIVVLSRHRPFALKALSLAERLPIISSRSRGLYQFYEGSHILFSPKNLLFAISLGFTAWLAECIAFYFVLVGLGSDGGMLLMVKASFILAASTLGGSLLLLPGGLGAAEGGITGLSQLLLDMPKGMAVVAALLIRLCTLWFGVGLGMVMLFFATRRLKLWSKVAQESI